MLIILLIWFSAHRYWARRFLRLLGISSYTITFVTSLRFCLTVKLIYRCHFGKVKNHQYSFKCSFVPSWFSYYWLVLDIISWFGNPVLYVIPVLFQLWFQRLAWAVAPLGYKKNQTRKMLSVDDKTQCTWKTKKSSGKIIRYNSIKYDFNSSNGILP